MLENDLLRFGMFCGCVKISGGGGGCDKVGGGKNRGGDGGGGGGDGDNGGGDDKVEVWYFKRYLGVKIRVEFGEL